tara:strand:+ start:989 stop:1609 length:621 start_codon:yes stop_codon:yes gene_type:complete
MSKWIEYKKGDPVPEGEVRIRNSGGWESDTYGDTWVGWGSEAVTHYMPQFKIEVGGVYKTRGGNRVEIVSVSGHEWWSYSGDNIRTYTSGGRTSIGNYDVPDDLVSKWEEPATTFKVGDTVRIIGNSSESCNEIGDVGVITGFHPKCAGVKVDGKPEWGNNHPFSDLEHYTPPVTATRPDYLTILEMVAGPDDVKTAKNIFDAFTD